MHVCGDEVHLSFSLQLFTSLSDSYNPNFIEDKEE